MIFRIWCRKVICRKNELAFFKKILRRIWDPESSETLFLLNCILMTIFMVYILRSVLHVNFRVGKLIFGPNAK